ncbi:MAG TPA: glycosyltransferase family 87 protein [Polyangia bacterium]|nr:glycosyltransferase family 87 protein [Polyangia bacterium]
MTNLANHPAQHSPAQRLVLHVYRLVSVVLGLWLLLGPLPSIAQKLPAAAADGGVGYYAARQLVAGHDPCDAAELQRAKLTGLGQPPTVAIWFLPFASLTPEQMGTDIRLLAIFALIAHLTLLALELGATTPIALTVLTFGFVFSRQFFLVHLDVGQISEFIACWIVATWFFLRRDEDVAAGICLGLACTMKVYPAIIALFFIASGRWRALIASLCTYAAVIVAITIRWGWRVWPHFFRSDKDLVNYWVSSLHNGSLYGILTRAFQPLGGRQPPSHSATALFFVLALALVAFFFACSRHNARRRDDWEIPFAFVAVLAPFLHPVAWEHYAVLWLLPVAIAITRLGRMTRWRHKLVAGSVVFVACYAMSLPMHYRSLFMRNWPLSPANRLGLRIYDVANWLPAVLLLALFGVLLVRSDRRSPLDTAQCR